MMSKKKLLPCPFCGGGKIIDTYTNFVPSLLCAGCGARMTVPMDSFGKDYTKLLKEKWNTRKPMRRIVEKLEETRKRNIEKHVYDGADEAFGGAIDIVKEEGGFDV